MVKKSKFLFVCCILVAIVLAPTSDLMIMDHTSVLQAASINQKVKNILKGDKFTLKISGTSKTIQWSSSNKSVAVVNSSGRVTGKGAGTATITATAGENKYTCIVMVRDTVDLIIFMGQSNMMGRGNASQAPALYDGAGYEYKSVTNPNKLYPIKEPFGKKQYSGNLNNYGLETGSLVTSFANEYFTRTKTPVVAVAATLAGSGSGSWSGESDNGWNLAKEAAKRYRAALSYLSSKGIKVRNKYMVWYQGENDVFAYKDYSTYQRQIKKIYRTMHSAGVEKCLLIRIGLKAYPTKSAYKTILKAQTKLCQTSSDFVLISTIASSLSTKYFARDRIHLTQAGLNKLGKNAGYYAAKYTKTKKDSSMQDSYYKNIYRPIR